ncbi:MAG: NusA-like transcription termination signal-binding factor [Euryarchaeota archaeon]|nr:NusA-like transcription termination signal-binding factor [Euryarchaeota archaeon]
MESMRLIAAFQSMTQSSVRDCVDEPDRLVFVVDETDIGRAIGKGGAHLERVKNYFKRDVEIIAYNPDPATFVGNIFRRHDVQKVEIYDRGGGVKRATVTVDPRSKGKAIGKGGRNIKLARLLAERHHGILEVAVE